MLVNTLKFQEDVYKNFASFAALRETFSFQEYLLSAGIPFDKEHLNTPRRVAFFTTGGITLSAQVL